MHVDLNKAIELIDAAIAERGPDYVYAPQPEEACRYFEGDEPGCIVGLAYAIAFPDLADHEKGQADNYGPSALPRWRGNVERSAALFLQEVQAIQDGGAPWGEAKELALHTVVGEPDHDGA